MASKHDFDIEATKSFERLPIFKKIIDDGWKVKRVNIDQGYKSILYINDKRKQLVLAFQGVQLEIEDFFLKDQNQISSTVYSVLSNLDIAFQTVLAYIDTQECVELSKKTSYSLTFTGYSFGAWLAEQSAFFSHREFKKRDVKAVTFESPGSKEYLDILNKKNVYSHETSFDLRDLDITTYLSEPNFVNTCNSHLNKVFRLYLDVDKLVDKASNFAKERNDFFLELIQKIHTDFMKKKIKKCYIENIQNKAHEFSFYLNGIKSLFSNGLDAMLKQFDPITERPKKFRKVLDWPKVDFNPSEEFKDHVKNLFNFESAFDLIPLGQVVPKIVKNITTKMLGKVSKAAVGYVSENFLGGFTVIVNLLFEIKDGNLKNEQCLKCFQLGDVMKYETGSGKNKDNIYKTRTFELNYQAHYSLIEVDYCIETIQTLTPGSLEYYMYKLKHGKHSKWSNNMIVERQLRELVKLYEIDNPNDKEFILKLLKKNN